MNLTNATLALLAFLSFSLLQGCSSTPIAAWERGDLSRTEMAWEPDPMQAGFRQHVYTAKEGASGGDSTGGGGCGCY